MSMHCVVYAKGTQLFDGRLFVQNIYWKGAELNHFISNELSNIFYNGVTTVSSHLQPTPKIEKEFNEILKQPKCACWLL